MAGVDPYNTEKDRNVKDAQDCFICESSREKNHFHERILCLNQVGQRGANTNFMDYVIIHCKNVIYQQMVSYSLIFLSTVV